MKIIITFSTYPRDGKTTYGLLEKTFKSLISNYDLSKDTIKIFVIGDDYENINELSPIFDNFDFELININKNDALRNKDVVSHLKWQHAVTRSIIYSFEKALNYDFDYLLISADDEIYTNNKIGTSIKYIEKYNYPDFVFSLGYFKSNLILPRKYAKKNLLNNYPLNSNVIESGTMYNLKNKNFINDIINFRKSRWNLIQKVLDNEIIYNKNLFSAEDAELWDYLLPKFKNKIYTSLLIPEVLIDHITEQTIFKYIK